MSRLVIAVDALVALPGVDAVAAVKLAELAGADAIRVGVPEGGVGLREGAVHELRRAAHCLELKLAPSPAALKLALEVQPDRVVLGSEIRGGVPAFGPIDHVAETGLPAVLRTLGEAGIPALAAVAPDVDAVKGAHGVGLAGVELFTGHVVDLPTESQWALLERLGDAARLAAKLRIPTALAGGLDDRNVGSFLERAPAAERVTVGRAVIARALLVGMDRAVRDLRARIP